MLVPNEEESVLVTKSNENSKENIFPENWQKIESGRGESVVTMESNEKMRSKIFIDTFYF